MAVTVVPWILGLGVTALALMSKKSSAATPGPGVSPEPKSDVIAQPPAVQVPPPTFTTQPVGGGVNIIPFPMPQVEIPPMIPREAQPIPDDELEPVDDSEFDAVSPGQPIPGQEPPKAKAPRVGTPIAIPVPPEVEEILEQTPLPPLPKEIVLPPIDIPVELPPMPGIIDLDDINDLPPDAMPIAPPALDYTTPTALATEVYNITQGKIRQLKGSEAKAIRAYQGEQGLKQDSLYGPETAESLIQFGFVPSTPWIWPSPAATSKREWNELMWEMSERDPQRSDEWALAAA